MAPAVPPRSARLSIPANDAAIKPTSPGFRDSELVESDFPSRRGGQRQNSVAADRLIAKMARRSALQG